MEDGGRGKEEASLFVEDVSRWINLQFERNNGI